MAMCDDFQWWLCSSFRVLAAAAERDRTATQTFCLPGVRLCCEASWTSQGCSVCVVEMVCEEPEHTLPELAKACKLAVCEPQICEVQVHCTQHSSVLLAHGFVTMGAGLDQFLLQPSAVCGTYGYGEEINAMHAAANAQPKEVPQPLCMLCSRKSVKTVTIMQDMRVPLAAGSYNMCGVCSSYWTWPSYTTIHE